MISWLKKEYKKDKKSFLAYTLMLLICIVFYSWLSLSLIDYLDYRILPFDVWCEKHGGLLINQDEFDFSTGKEGVVLRYEHAHNKEIRLIDNKLCYIVPSEGGVI